MTDSTQLERRYRRLLAFYPRAFRREREQEMVSVLIEGAKPGQRWPRRAEALDLLKTAIPMRLRWPTSVEQRHPGPWIVVRILTGMWLAFLTTIFCTSGHWWGLSLLAPAALHFFLAFRLAMILERRRAGPGAS